MKNIIIKMSKNEAYALGLLVCECGHRWNNHFQHEKKPCAHCSCKVLKEVPVRGKFVKEAKK